MRVDPVAGTGLDRIGEAFGNIGAPWCGTMNRCWASKGMASRRGQALRSNSGSRPSLWAATTSAPSMGSPSTVHCPSL